MTKQKTKEIERTTTKYQINNQQERKKRKRKEQGPRKKNNENNETRKEVKTKNERPTNEQKLRIKCCEK